MSARRCFVLSSLFTLSFCTFILAGCAVLPEISRSAHVGDSGPVGSCASFFALLDQSTKEAGVLDPGAFRVRSYPYLRVNRFLASFRNEVEDKAAFAAWVDQMQALDQNARRDEIANLAIDHKDTPSSENERDELFSKVVSCGNLLKTVDFQEAEQKKEFTRRVSVSDDYITLRRVFGLYPLVSLFVAQRVASWQAQARNNFSLEPPTGWRAIRYVPAGSGNELALGEIVAQTEQNALGIPLYSPEAKEALFRFYAPIWEVQTLGDFDLIGSPFWTKEDVLDVDVKQPVTYTLLSFTRFKSEILTQLNYIIWFPSRPKESATDPYGGLLDGINYRVTLDKNGEPLLYELVHNCGCYYMSFPTKRLEILEKITYAEPPLILQAPDVNPPTEFMTVAMESRTHYVQHLYPLSRKKQPESVVYSLIDYGKLLSLQFPGGGRKSMFSQDSTAPGLVKIVQRRAAKGWSDGFSGPQVSFLPALCASGAVMQWLS